MSDESMTCTFCASPFGIPLAVEPLAGPVHPRVVAVCSQCRERRGYPPAPAPVDADTPPVLREPLRERSLDRFQHREER